MNTAEVTEAVGAVLLIAGLIAALACFGVIEGSWSASLKLVPRYKRSTPPAPRSRKAAAGTAADDEPAAEPALSAFDRRVAQR
jgi:hypothetical protein